MRRLGLSVVLFWGVGCAGGERSGDALEVSEVDSVHEVGDAPEPDTVEADGGVDSSLDVEEVDDVHIDGLGPDAAAEVVEDTLGDGEPGETVEPHDTMEPGDVGDTGDTGDSADPGDGLAETDTADPYAGLVDQALREVLRAEATLGHTPLGYDAGRDAMYAVGGLDDVGGRIECIYTGRTVDATGSRTPNRNCRKADGTPMSCSFNTEHTWARYYLRAALTEGTTAYYAAEGDIHHLRPSDDDVNNARWHFDFGETNCPADGACKVSEGSELGQRPGITGHANCPTGNLTLSHVCVMEVRPERQGDIARGMFYMATRYGMAMDDAMEDVLREWNRSDPPDARERTRNDGAHAAQGNRNVFVDRPELVDRMSDF